ncbi:MAG: hypothetical protein CBB74_01970 [Owenweeksia sp. TMED14]|jgi:hypothetical protein|nr:MAG: hypothetical protein CBB74_01970 [Owenweeksia sp. TMED14]
MNHIKYFTLLILSIGIMLNSCDIIDEPFKDSISPIDTVGLVQSDTIIQTQKAVLIEDFTGHRCKNCPKASKAINELDSLFDSQVIPLAIHAGPSNFTGVNNEYPTDFTTEYSDDLATHFGISAMPMGLVQRIDYPNSHQKTYTAWSGITNLELAKSPEALFTLSTEYDAPNRIGVLNYSVEMISNQSNPLWVAVYIKETGIISPQLMPNNSRNETYVHKNVFRSAPLGPFGISISENGGTSGQTFTGSVTANLDPLWDANECEWVILIYDRSNYKVIQPASISL